MKRLLLLRPLLILPLALLPACVPVRVAVPDPVKIDVNMKVDVTTRTEGAVPAAPGTAATPATGTGTNAPAAVPAPGGATPAAAPTRSAAGADLHKLSGELQSFKNDRLVGENNQGYLEVRQEPDGKLASGETYSAYVDRVVKQANDDRKEIYSTRADKSGDPIETTQTQAAQRRRDAALSGEWFQDPSGAWKQKP